MRILSVCIVYGCVLISLTACQRGSMYEADLASTAQDVVLVAVEQVAIDEIAFNPMTLEIAPNTKVVWTNDDDVKHTVTARSGSLETFDSGTLESGDTFSYTFTKEGAIMYASAYYPTMRGIISVTSE